MEYHVLVVWARGQSYVQRILDDLSDVEIYDIFQIEWSEDRFSQNLTRLYDQALPKGCRKEKQVGVGAFTCFILRDRSPKYDMRRKRNRWIKVNTKIFDKKIKYRNWAGSNVIHATNTVEESMSDIKKLLGIDYTTLRSSKIWDGTIKPYLRNVVDPAVGWENIMEMFNALDSTVGYLVLRNFENLPEKYTVGSHGDIDILVGNLENAVEVANAYYIKNQVHFGVKINGKEVRFDFRNVGDDYYCEKWERDLLERKIILTPTKINGPGSGGFYGPTNKDYFYSLLYHAIVQKRSINPDYIPRLLDLAKKIGIDSLNKSLLGNRTFLLELLTNYMEQEGYSYVKPSDPTVHYRR